MSDLRRALSHVLWIGGGPQAGKTTLARLLAGTYDLRIYNIDWHAVREHREPPTAAGAAFARLSLDERWAQPRPIELLERSLLIWSEGFARVVDDLLALPRDRPVVAEGPGALPWCVAPLLLSARQALFLIPTARVRSRNARRRWGRDQERRFPGPLQDHARAIEKIRARDVMLDARIAAACADLGLRCEVMDGARDLDASLEMLEEQFQPHLPPRRNV